MTHTTQFLINHGLPLVFGVVFLEQMGLPIPSSPLLLAAGALGASGQFNMLLGLAVTVFACLLADAFWFYLGRHRGGQVLGLLCRISLEPDSCVRRTQNLFTRYGLRAVLVAKFVPGLNTIAPPLAGMAGVSAGRFLLFDGMGSVLYAGCFILLGHFFSDQIEQVLTALGSIGGGAFGLIAGAAGFYVTYKYWQRQRLLRELRTARITVEEVRRKQEAGEELVILDLRSSAELNLDPSVILGARHVAADEIEKDAEAIPRDREVVVYCSCPNEVTSALVALSLQRRGFTRVRPLLGGIDAWRGQNYPMEKRASKAAEALESPQSSGDAAVSKPALAPAAIGVPTRAAKGWSGKQAILLAAAAGIWVTGYKERAHAPPPPPLVEVAPVTRPIGLLVNRGLSVRSDGSGEPAFTGAGSRPIYGSQPSVVAMLIGSRVGCQYKEPPP